MDSVTLDQIDTLDSYIELLGVSLADKIQDEYRPLHLPGVDPIDPRLATLRKDLFPAQKHCVTAAIRALDVQKSVFMVAEQGTGKTVMASGLVHAHARGNPYRSIVMVPDHLIRKWIRHIEAWVPDAEVRSFDRWSDWVRLADTWQATPKVDRKRPGRPQWYVIGRDASKFDPSWAPKYVERGDVVEDFGTMRVVKGIACSECGAFLKDSKGKLLTLKEISGTKRSCKEITKVWDEESGRFVEGPRCGSPFWGFIGTPSNRSKDTYRQALAIRKLIDDAWSTMATKPKDRADRINALTAEYKALAANLIPEQRRFAEEAFLHGKQIFWRWAPARTIQKRLKGFFDYCIIDELHEEKSSVSAQANAAGKIASAAKHVIGLTGTLIGGYASHVFPITYRLCPDSIVAEGFEWGQELAFSEVYGRVDEVVITSEKEESKVSNSNSMGSKETTKRKKYIKPGIMPTLFGRHLISNTVFLSLDEVSDALPPRPIDEVIGLPMPEDMATAYRFIETRIKETIAPMLAMGDTSLLAKMLQTLLAYADHPWGWNDGYLDPFFIKPCPEFSKDLIYPKEKAILDECLAERDRGRKVWVYCQMTGKRDVMDRLASLMKRHGLNAAIMRSDVDRVEREDWIIKHAPALDVMISHPKLVETGLDLFYHDVDTGIGHNFPTIAWFQTGYNLFTLRQASRRAWRIGQSEACRVLYYFYEQTMQERAMELIGRKLSAAEALDGKFSSEGLAALAGDDSLELELARSLSGKINGAARVWSRMTGATAWVPKPAMVAAVTPPPGAPAPAHVSPNQLADLIRSNKGTRGLKKSLPGQLAFEW